MLALSACMQSALHHINSTWPFTEQTLFVDDHTWASPSLHELQQVKSRHSFWQHYTATIGIPENTKKAQYLIDGDRLGAKLWRKLYGLRLRLQPPRPHHLPWHHLDLGPHNRPMLHCEAEIQPRQHRKRNYVPEPSQLQHLPAPPPPHHVGGARKRVSTHKKPRPSRPPQQTLQDLAGDNNYRLPPTKNTNHSGSDRRPRRDPALPISATTSTRKPATKRQHSHIDAEARDHRDLYPKEASRLEAKLATLQCLTKNPTAPTHQSHPPANLSYRVGGHKHYTEASILVRLTLRWNPGPRFCSLNLWISFYKGVILVMLAHHENRSGIL